jgi:hypothetical protein
VKLAQVAASVEHGAYGAPYLPAEVLTSIHRYIDEAWVNFTAKGCKKAFSHLSLFWSSSRDSKTRQIFSQVPFSSHALSLR